MRDLFFIGLVGGGLFTVGVNLMPPRLAQAPSQNHAASELVADEAPLVERVDASFRKQRPESRTAHATSDLQVSRRLALGLMGTLPSLQDILQLESLPASERQAWWLDHVLADRRFADYFAERLARAFVGTENGPFLLFRRR